MMRRTFLILMACGGALAGSAADPGCENGVPANTFGATAGTVYWGQIGGFKILVR